jgi:hypothetical protein
MFNDIHVVRYDEYGTPQQDIKVNLTYAPKRKFYTAYKQKLLHPSTLTLPRISFSITGLSYDDVRQTNPQTKLRQTSDVDPDILRYIYNPVPYNITYNLIVWYKNIDDGMQVIEQIVPYFTPYYNITISEFPEFGIKRDVSLYLDPNIEPDLTDDLSEDAGSIRVGYWVLNFTMKGWLYPPIKDTAVIKKVISYLRIMDHTSPRVVLTTSVDPIDAAWDDEWDIKQEKEVNDPYTG